MRSINMIETLGSGIPRVYRLQRQRGFPMTDYNLNDPRTVAVTVYGQVLDENYTRVLLAKPEIEIRDVIALDKVQKGIRLDASAFARLRDRRLVEGTRTAARITAHITPAGDIEDEDIGAAIIVHLRSAGGTGKSSAIAQALLPRMSPSLGDVQKTNKVRNALQQLSRDGLIANVGSGGRGAIWKLLE
jgi:ATP-dependent DNA helicase RecG